MEGVQVECWSERVSITFSDDTPADVLSVQAMTMRPDLFELVVGDVPFMDCVNEMFDESLPLAITDRDV
jgi:oligopeptidase B